MQSNIQSNRGHKINGYFSAALIVSALAYLSTAFADEPGASRTDPRLAGLWEIESGVNNGTPIPEDELKGSRTIVRENAITTYDADDNVTYRCTYTFSDKKQPNTIDMLSTLPDNQDAKAIGIYKVDDDYWVLCYSHSGERRPGQFESEEGSEVILLKMKRKQSGESTK